MLTAQAQQTMLYAATGAWPKEACGIIINDVAYEITNVANKPCEFFEMSSAELIDLAPLGAPTALWHSHPGGASSPSSADLEHHPPGLRLYIIANGVIHDHGIPNTVAEVPSRQP